MVLLRARAAPDMWARHRPADPSASLAQSASFSWHASTAAAAIPARARVVVARGAK